MPPDERATHLHAVDRSGIRRGLRELAVAADREISDLTAYIVGHFRIVMSAPLKSWHERIEGLIEAPEDMDTAAALDADLSDCRERQTTIRRRSLSRP